LFALEVIAEVEQENFEIRSIPRIAKVIENIKIKCLLLKKLNIILNNIFITVEKIEIEN